jgi:ATPase subunit of ABC transporter with duplicated ATPase domains
MDTIFIIKPEEVLRGLGFSNDSLIKPYKQFSGGWRMRVLLAKMILMKPDVLLLDEPTNHLDLPSIEWLEKYLQHYQGAVVVVSHDRYFLDRMVTKIVELYQQATYILYSGNYSFYETEKAAENRYSAKGLRKPTGLYPPTEHGLQNDLKRKPVKLPWHKVLSKNSTN